jgi:hypothetical protein
VFILRLNALSVSIMVSKVRKKPQEAQEKKPGDEPGFLLWSDSQLRQIVTQLSRIRGVFRLSE